MGQGPLPPASCYAFLPDWCANLFKAKAEHPLKVKRCQTVCLYLQIGHDIHTVLWHKVVVANCAKADTFCLFRIWRAFTLGPRMNLVLLGMPWGFASVSDSVPSLFYYRCFAPIQSSSFAFFLRISCFTVAFHAWSNAWYACSCLMQLMCLRSCEVPLFGMFAHGELGPSKGAPVAVASGEAQELRVTGRQNSS